MPLPWASERRNLLLLRFALDALLLAVLPLAWLGWAVRRHSWRWGVGLLLYLASVGYAVSAGWLLPKQLSSFGDLFTASEIMAWAEPVFAPLGWLGIKADFRWLRIPLGLPPVLGVGLLLWTASRRRWRRLGLVVLAVLLISFLAALAWLRLETSRYDPAQYYSWYGWPWAALYGAYGLGLLGAVCWLLLQTQRLGRRLWRRLRPAA
jgi:hypothetical protein